jgi:hypothetical protein
MVLMSLALLALLAAWPAFAQPIAKLQLQTIDPFEPDRRATIVRNPAPGIELVINQRDPRATGRAAVMQKKKASGAFFTITAKFSVESANECIGGIWLAGNYQPNGVLFGVQPSLHRRRLFILDAVNGADLVQPFSFVGGVAWERVQENEAIRAYSVSSDGADWTQVFTEPSNSKTQRYGLAVENRKGTPAAPDCELKVYQFQEAKP